MSEQNVLAFFSHAKTNPELAAKLDNLFRDSERNAVDSLVRIADESGFPFSAREFLTVVKRVPSPANERDELSDEQLQAVSGGADSVPSIVPPDWQRAVFA